MSFFDRLKLAIKEKNTTITDIEKNIGFGRGTIGKWKNSSPSYDNIIKVINYLQVDLYYLMQDELTFEKKENLYLNDEDKINYIKKSDVSYNSKNNYTISNSFNNIKSDEKMIIELLLNKFLENTKNNDLNNELSKKEKYILSIYNQLTSEDKIKIEGIIENKVYNYI